MSKGKYEVREGLMYTKDHEWIMIKGDVFTIGVTDYASHEMGDIAFVELPEVGKTMKKGDLLCEIESVKAVSEIRSPFDCTIKEVNKEVEDAPEALSEDPFGTWIVRLENVADKMNLLNDKEYAKLLDSLDD